MIVHLPSEPVRVLPITFVPPRFSRNRRILRLAMQSGESDCTFPWAKGARSVSRIFESKGMSWAGAAAAPSATAAMVATPVATVTRRDLGVKLILSRVPSWWVAQGVPRGGGASCRGVGPMSSGEPSAPQATRAGLSSRTGGGSLPSRSATAVRKRPIASEIRAVRSLGHRSKACSASGSST